MYVVWIGLSSETVDEISFQYPGFISQEFSHAGPKGVDLFSGCFNFLSAVVTSSFKHPIVWATDSLLEPRMPFRSRHWHDKYAS